ncbi:MAG: type II toxin-antitoxin system RelE/ParE family toxin [bacterium]
MYKRLDPSLKEEVKSKILLFQNEQKHASLKLHKLKGVLENTYAFSVNYKVRIVFEYENKTTANLLYVGAHDEVYT